MLNVHAPAGRHSRTWFKKHVGRQSELLEASVSARREPASSRVAGAWSSPQPNEAPPRANAMMSVVDLCSMRCALWLLDRLLHALAIDAIRLRAVKIRRMNPVFSLG